MRHTALTMTLLASAALSSTACGDSPVGADPATLCATSQGLEVCVGRGEYSPADEVETSVRNTTSETVRAGYCSMKAVGKTDLEADFETVYSPTVRCGADVDLDEIRSLMVEIPPGATETFDPPLSPFAFQGFYRVNVWILDENGERVAGLPAFSGTFLVIPTAGS